MSSLKNEITFGIITSSLSDIYMPNIIDSIENASKDYFKYEIIVVGGKKEYKQGDHSLKYKHIPFDETIKRGWITKQKNLIVTYAKYDIIVFLHDYVALSDDWFTGMKKYIEQNNFDVLITKIKNKDGSRFRDWTLFPPFVHGYYGRKKLDYDTRKGCLLPYDFEASKLNDYIYFSGAYFIAKKYVMKEFPLNEKLIWGQGEDADWSLRVSTKYKFKCNPYSTVHFLKQKNTCSWEKEINNPEKII